MLKVKQFLFFVLLLAVVGCSAPTMNLVSTAGERIPHPFYTAKPTGNIPMSFIWYYAKWEGYEDADGTTQTFPTYLDRKREHTIESKTTLGLDMILRVFNPTLKEYSIFVNKNVKFKSENGYGRRYVKGTSVMEYREWTFHFATSDRVEAVDFNIEVSQGENTLLRTKTFRYSVN